MLMPRTYIDVALHMQDMSCMCHVDLQADGTMQRGWVHMGHTFSHSVRPPYVGSGLKEFSSA